MDVDPANQCILNSISTNNIIAGSSLFIAALNLPA